MGIQEDFLEKCRVGDAFGVRQMIEHNHHYAKSFLRGMHKLVGREIDVNALDPVTGETPLTIAAQNGHATVIKHLTPYLTPESVNAMNKQQFSALMLASKGNHINAMNALLAIPGIEANKTNRFNHDALILIASNNRAEYIHAAQALLAQPGFDPNPIAPRVKTALMWAAEKGHRQIVEALLAHPTIDIHRLDRNNDTAITIAFESGHRDIVTLLEQHGAILPEHLRQEANNHINGNQSVHEVSVHISVSRSAKKLAAQYAFTPEQVAEQLKEISTWLENDFKDPSALPREYNPIWLEPAKRSVERLRELDFIDQRSGISMQQALAFVWAGINNPSAKVTEKNPTLLDINEIVDRRISFLKSLYEIQREYNLSGGANPTDNGEDDKPTCVSGSFNKLIASLSSVGHNGVEILFVTKAYIAEQIGFLTKKAFGCLPREERAKFAEEWEGENQEKVQESCFSLLKTWVKDKLHTLFDEFKEELPDLDNIIEESASVVSDTDMDDVIEQQRKANKEETKREEEVEEEMETPTVSLPRSKTLTFTLTRHKTCASEVVNNAVTTLVSSMEKLSLVM